VRKKDKKGLFGDFCEQAKVTEGNPAKSDTQRSILRKILFNFNKNILDNVFLILVNK